MMKRIDVMMAAAVVFGIVLGVAGGFTNEAHAGRVQRERASSVSWDALTADLIPETDGGIDIGSPTHAVGEVHAEGIRASAYNSAQTLGTNATPWYVSYARTISGGSNGWLYMGSSSFVPAASGASLGGTTGGLYGYPWERVRTKELQSGSSGSILLRSDLVGAAGGPWNLGGTGASERFGAVYATTLNLSGAASVASLTASGNIQASGTLSATGDLLVDGDVQLDNGDLTTTGTLSAGSVSGGSLTVTGSVTGGSLSVSGAASVGAADAASLTLNPAALGTCDASAEGTLASTGGGATSATALCWCASDGSSVYAWVALHGSC